jgi:hypothetical protein
MLRDSHFFQVVLERGEALEVLRKFTTGEYKLKDVRTVALTCKYMTDAQYVFRPDDVYAMHTFEAEVLMEDHKFRKQQLEFGKLDLDFRRRQLAQARQQMGLDGPNPYYNPGAMGPLSGPN